MLMTGGCGVCILQKKYTVINAYNILQSTNQQNIADDNHVLRNRLSMKNNLFKRAVILATVQSCVGGCGHMEDVTHIFVHCNIFVIFWIVVYDWLDVVMVTPYRISDHLTQFSVLGGFSKYKYGLLLLI
jgi:hypothetical protein